MNDFERSCFTHSNCQLSFVDFGSPDKPDLLLLHGMRDHALSLLNVAQALKHDFHVVALDMRGHGRSDNPGIYTMIHYVSDVRALVQHCGLENPVIVAHSMGGHIASRYTAAFHDEVTRLILLDGMGPPDWTHKPDVNYLKLGLRHGVEAVSTMYTEGRQMADTGEATRRLRENNPLLSAELADVIVEHGVRAHSQGGVGWSFDPSVQMIWHTFPHHESEDIWRSIDCPVLIVTGSNALNYWVANRPELKDQSEFYSASLKRKQQLFGDACHCVVDGAGHMLHYDQPDRLNTVLRDFLVG
jgi:pimeloyl-ACP methyl ester carboxylesterase